MGLWWNQAIQKTIQKRKKTVQKILHDINKISQHWTCSTGRLPSPLLIDGSQHCTWEVSQLWSYNLGLKYKVFFLSHDWRPIYLGLGVIKGTEIAILNLRWQKISRLRLWFSFWNYSKIPWRVFGNQFPKWYYSIQLFFPLKVNLVHLFLLRSVYLSPQCQTLL